MNRTRLATLNSATVFTTQIVSLILKFVLQTVFIHFLRQDFVGLNGLFSDVISFLSFADLGIGTSITVALYGPIANNDIPELKGLLVVYRKVYRVIGIMITLVGITIAPFVHLFIKNSVFSSNQISLWFVLYLIGTTATYFAAYKRSFLMANQQGYLSSLNDFTFKSLQMVLQVVALVVWKSYFLFLIIQLICVVLSNVQISRLTSSRHQPIFEDSLDAGAIAPDQAVRTSILKNVVGSISSNVGSIIVFGTDNVVLSSFVGLGAVAKYSNYMLIIQSLNSIFSQALKAMVASVGNLNVTSDGKKKESVLLRMLYLNGFINVILVTGLSTGLTFFVQVWAGKHYLLSTMVVAIILLNFLVNQSRYTAQNFISGMGLFWPLRWKSLIEAGLNLVVSLTLVATFDLGISGVVLGTLSSNILVNAWWEPLIVYKYSLKMPMTRYFKQYLEHLLISIICLLIGLFMSRLIYAGGFIAFIMVEILSEFIAVLLFILVTFKSAEFEFYFSYLKRALKR